MVEGTSEGLLEHPARVSGRQADENTSGREGEPVAFPGELFDERGMLNQEANQGLVSDIACRDEEEALRAILKQVAMHEVRVLRDNEAIFGIRHARHLDVWSSVSFA
jgi:hypothetical protein